MTPLDIWYEVSSSGPLPSFFSNYTPGAKNGPTRVHMLYIGLNREKHEKNLLV